MKRKTLLMLALCVCASLSAQVEITQPVSLNPADWDKKNEHASTYSGGEPFVVIVRETAPTPHEAAGIVSDVDLDEYPYIRIKVGEQSNTGWIIKVEDSALETNENWDDPRPEIGRAHV